MKGEVNSNSSEISMRV